MIALAVFVGTLVLAMLLTLRSKRALLAGLSFVLATVVFGAALAWTS